MKLVMLTLRTLSSTINTASAIKVPLSFQLDESLANMKNNIIFSTNFKIFFYDYITDGIKQINET